MTDNTNPHGRVAIVNDLPEPIQNEPFGVAMVMSVGLAQFIADISMMVQPNFDKENPDHMALLGEFIDLKKKIRAEIAPVLEFSELLEKFEQLLEDAANGKSRSDETA